MLNKFTEFILFISDWFVRMFVLNLLWLLFTLLGGVIFGIVPATYALMHTIKDLFEKRQYPLLVVFWTHYKQVFIRSQAVGGILWGTGLVLLVDIYYFSTHKFTGSFILLSISIGILIVYLIGIVFLFPIMTYFQATPLEYFKISFFVGFKHLKYSLLLLAGSVSLVVLCLLLPALLIFFLASLLSIWSIWVASVVLPTYTGENIYTREEVQLDGL